MPKIVIIELYVKIIASCKGETFFRHGVEKFASIIDVLLHKNMTNTAYFCCMGCLCQRMVVQMMHGCK